MSTNDDSSTPRYLRTEAARLFSDPARQPPIIRRFQIPVRRGVPLKPATVAFLILAGMFVLGIVGVLYSVAIARDNDRVEFLKDAANFLLVGIVISGALTTCSVA